MTEVLSFPGLGLEFELNRVAFTMGPITVYWYGIIIATALLLGVVYAMKRSNEFGINSDKLMDILLVGTIGAIVGARAYYVAFSFDMFKDDLLSVFKIWEGGIAIYGGIIGALIVGVIMAKYKKVKVLPLVDLAMSGFLLGQGIGRWGNFMNIEAFGSNTTMPWGMTSQSIVSYLEQHQAGLAEIGVVIDPTMPVHPTFFYESIWCLIGFAIVAFYTKHRRFDGEITLFYAMWYGVERFVVEGLRTDSLMIGNFRISQMLAGVSVIIAAAILIYVRVKIKKANDENYLKPFGKTEEGLAIAAAEQSEKKNKPSRG